MFSPPPSVPTSNSFRFSLKCKTRILLNEIAGLLSVEYFFSNRKRPFDKRYFINPLMDAIQTMSFLLLQE